MQTHCRGWRLLSTFIQAYHLGTQVVPVRSSSHSSRSNQRPAVSRVAEIIPSIMKRSPIWMWRWRVGRVIDGFSCFFAFSKILWGFDIPKKVLWAVFFFRGINGSCKAVAATHGGHQSILRLLQFFWGPVKFILFVRVFEVSKALTQSRGMCLCGEKRPLPGNCDNTQRALVR